MYKWSIAVANYLKTVGVTKGDVVGVCCVNFIEIPALMIGVALSGAIYSPFNPTYTETIF